MTTYDQQRRPPHDRDLLLCRRILENSPRVGLLASLAPCAAPLQRCRGPDDCPAPGGVCGRYSEADLSLGGPQLGECLSVLADLQAVGCPTASLGAPRRAVVGRHLWACAHRR